MDQSTSSSNQTSKLRKGISLIPGLLIICSVALMVFGAVWYYFNYIFKPNIENSLNKVQNSITTSTAKTNKSSDWKTYTNTVQGYLFKYPKNYYFVDTCYNTITERRVDYTDSAKKLVFVDKAKIADNIPGCESDFPQPYLGFSTLPEPIDLDQQKSSSTTDLESEVKIAGQKWLKIIFTKPSELDGSYSTWLFVNYQNKGYVISWKNSDAKGTHDSMVDKIVATFKFTK